MRIARGSNAGARAFKVRGTKLKVGGPKFFIYFSPEKHAEHNAITSMNNSLMHLKIILIDVTSSELLFSGAFL